MWDDVASRFARLAADAGVDQARLRVVRERTESVSVRQDVLQPVGRRDDLGAMVTVVDGAGSGYAATPDPLGASHGRARRGRPPPHPRAAAGR
jgi:predicted Zn-dependent protease